MSDADDTTDSRNRGKTDAAESARDQEQRRFRGQHKDDQRTPADAQRDEIRGEETAHDAPTDPVDDAFLKSK